MSDAERDELSTRRPVVRAFDDILAQLRSRELGGTVADYIPELANADPEAFGIAAATVAGESYGAGDASARFTIQSISKPFVYALALAELGVDGVSEHVGVEPSGEAFNAISFDQRGRPANPLINAGAVVVASLIGARDADERFARIRDGLSAFAGRPLDLDEKVYQSESKNGDRNRALAALARSFGRLGATVEDAVDPYFRQCSLLVDCIDLAVMGATLANNGVNPLSGRRVVDDAVARNTLSIMASCGMYDRSGQWIMSVGMPAKSGVGGGIVAVTPGRYGIGVFSPPLDEAGNSVRGVEALRMLSDGFGLHMFNHPNPVAPIESVTTDAATATVTVRVRGVIDFVAAQLIIFESIAAARSASGVALVLDFRGATTVTDVAAGLIRGLKAEATHAEYTVTVLDPARLLAD
jgi:glutaminase